MVALSRLDYTWKINNSLPRFEQCDRIKVSTENSSSKPSCETPHSRKQHNKKGCVNIYSGVQGHKTMLVLLMFTWKYSYNIYTYVIKLLKKNKTIILVLFLFFY